MRHTREILRHKWLLGSGHRLVTSTLNVSHGVITCQGPPNVIAPRPANVIAPFGSTAQPPFEKAAQRPWDRPM